MKLKVITRYVDKNTKVLHEIDEIVEHDQARAQELLDAGVCEKYKAPKKKKEE